MEILRLQSDSTVCRVIQLSAVGRNVFFFLLLLSVSVHTTTFKYCFHVLFPWSIAFDMPGTVFVFRISFNQVTAGESLFELTSLFFFCIV